MGLERRNNEELDEEPPYSFHPGVRRQQRLHPEVEFDDGQMSLTFSRGLQGPEQGSDRGRAWPDLCVRNNMPKVACQASWCPKQDTHGWAKEVVSPTIGIVRRGLPGKPWPPYNPVWKAGFC